MLELVSVLTGGGMPLWHERTAGIGLSSLAASSGSSTESAAVTAVNEAMEQVFLEGRQGKLQLHNSRNGQHVVRWHIDAPSDTVCVAVQRKGYPLKHIEELLEAVHEFALQYLRPLGGAQSEANAALATGFVPQALSERELKIITEFYQTKQRELQQRGQQPKRTPTPTVTVGESETEVAEDGAHELLKSVDDSGSGTRSRSGSKSPRKSKGPAGGGKKGRQWGDALSEDDVTQLDFSSDTDKTSVRTNAEHLFDSNAAKLSGEVDDLVADDGTSQTNSGGLLGYFKNLASGTAQIDEVELQKVVNQTRDHLISKNVASDVAEDICVGIEQSLKGTRISNFSSVAAAVKDALKDQIEQILTPKRRINILRDIEAAKRAKKPYVITMVGVNGVGKSTNLAKIAFWLARNGHRIMIAAGDTFRSGAIEQLRTHTMNLCQNFEDEDIVALYDQGYEKDAANVARDAIQQARREERTVVLVDTAGRMQDNEPLMRALAKLVQMNQPDLILFVGEALVGNEAVDQLVKFNQALGNLSSSQEPRLIDGIVLTKFDTIDDKVGAAISMTHITGQPVIFVGVGQRYSDLRKLNTTAVVESLMR
eukprot:Clim_evm1s195 gene=Clim_evmTU1s195